MVKKRVTINEAADHLPTASKEYIRTVLKLHKAVQQAGGRSLKLKAPITKGGRFPLVSHSFDMAQCIKSKVHLMKDT